MNLAIKRSEHATHLLTSGTINLFAVRTVVNRKERKDIPCYINQQRIRQSLPVHHPCQQHLFKTSIEKTTSFRRKRLTSRAFTHISLNPSSQKLATVNLLAQQAKKKTHPGAKGKITIFSCSKFNFLVKKFNAALLVP